MDAYEKLRRKLDLFPIGFPRGEDTHRILELLFSPEEALAASYVPNPPFTAAAVRVASKSGMSPRDAELMLQSLEDRGLIAGYKVFGQKRYHLIPAVPGFLELQFMEGRALDDKRREIGRLWHRAMHGEFGEENYGFPTNGARVIPIRKSVDTTQSIFNFEEAEQLIRRSTPIAVTDCACRKSGQNCDAPINVCFMLNTSANYTVPRGRAHKVSLREAVSILETAADAGLVHTTSNTMAPVQILCNCCRCCCATLYGVTHLNKPASGVRSNFVCRAVAPNNCKQCNTCVKACPVEALEIANDHVVVDNDRCIGCGVCVHACPTQTLALVRRDNQKPPLTTVHVVAKMINERGKTKRVLSTYLDDLF